jgi:hypothetical protein
MAEQKIDGWRASYLTGIEGKPCLWSRTGQPLYGVAHIEWRLSLMERVAGQPMFFDGEWQVEGSLEATKAWGEKGHRSGADAGHFYAFDCMTMEEWRAGGSDEPLYRRKARLAALAKAVEDDPALSWEWRPRSRGQDGDASPVTVLRDVWVSDAGDVLAEARRIWAAGGEGLMLKDPEAPYRRNRNTHWLKVKQGGPYWRNV